MLDPVQALISVTGVSLILSLVWLATRNAPPLTLGGEAGVRARLAREVLGFRIGQLAVEPSDRRALAISADGGEVVLLFVMGTRVVWWRLPLAKLGRIERKSRDGGVTLELHTGDFTRPEFSLAVPDVSLLPAQLRACV
jgi:hypothetical protein